MSNIVPVKQAPLVGLAGYGGGVPGLFYLGAGGTSFFINKSLRLNSADSAYLSRTPSSAGNRRTMTISFWYKNTIKSTSGQQPFLAGQFTSPAKDYYTMFTKLDDGSLFFSARLGGSDLFTLRTSQVLRDPSAWYHIVLAIDTTQATAANRVKFYINGSQVTDFQTETYPSQNKQMDYLNENQLHFIGRRLDNSYEYFDGYLTDFFFIDGSALEPTSFGEFDDNGIWQGKEASGLTFGTNGFHLLDFANESTVGHDSSANNNDFTANNIGTGGNGDYISELNNVNDFYGNGRANWGPKLFNGATGDKGPIPAAGTPMTYTPSSSITLTGTGLRIWVARNKGGLYINGNSVSSTEQQWNSFGTTYSPLTSIEWRTTDGSNFSQLSAIEINGTQLIDNTAAGADNDILFDVPTNGTQSDTGAGGEVSGNYATINPLHTNVTNMSVTNGNLNVTRSQTSQGRIAGTIGITSGKYYFEATRTTTGGIGNNVAFGVTDIESAFGTGQYGGNPTSSGGASQEWVLTDRSTAVNGSTYTNLNSTLGNVTDGDVVQVAVDMTAGKIWFGKNGTFSGTPASGSSAAFSNLSGTVVPLFYVYNGGWAFNAGQRSFAYSAPSGYKALCTTNLPTPTIADGSAHFQTNLWTGNGAARSITTTGMSPDFVWIKNRGSGTYHHTLVDSVRGAGNRLMSNLTNAEDNGAGYGIVSAFNSDSFSLDGGGAAVNASNNSYVGWSWDAGSSTVSNTDGNVTTNVRANTSAGFSIVTYTGSGSSTASYGHGLGVEPHLIITKKRNAANDWYLYFKVLGNGKYLSLNSTNAAGTLSNYWGTVNNTVFSQTYTTAGPNNGTQVAYCFAPVAGYSAFGSYEGNGSLTNGSFTFLGFTPALVIIKNTQSSGSYSSWGMWDSARNINAPALTSFNDPLWANRNVQEGKRGDGSSDASGAENTVHLLSNGFQVFGNGTEYNNSGVEYVYAAWAENPFQANGGLAR